MEPRSQHPEILEWSQSDTTMSAAEAFAQMLFDQADNDAKYHHPVSLVRYAIAHGECEYTPEEIAEQILAWSGAL